MMYCYETRDGVVLERVFPVGKAPRTIRVGRKVAKRSFGAERKSFPATKGWPIECCASGVHASQAGELRTHFERAGVPTEVTKNGDPVYRDAQHRRKALKCRGLVDKASFI